MSFGAGGEIRYTVTVDARNAAQQLQSVGQQFQQLGQSTQQATQEVQQLPRAMDQTTRSTQSMGSVLKNNVLALGNVASGIIGLISQYTQLQRAQNTLARAENTAATMKNRITVLQNKLNDAIAKYGANSSEAADLQQKLNIAQDKYRVTGDKITIMQEQLNERMADFAVNILPSFIQTGSGIVQVAQGFASMGKEAKAAQGPTQALSAATTSLGRNAVATWGKILGPIAAVIGVIELAKHNIGGLGQIFTDIRTRVEQAFPALKGFFDIIVKLGESVSAIVEGRFGDLEKIWQSVPQTTSAAAAGVDEFGNAVGESGKELLKLQKQSDETAKKIMDMWDELKKAPNLSDAFKIKIDENKLTNKLLDYLPDKLTKQIKINIKTDQSIATIRGDFEELIAQASDINMSDSKVDKLVKGTMKYLKEKFPKDPESKNMQKELGATISGPNTLEQVRTLIQKWKLGDNIGDVGTDAGNTIGTNISHGIQDTLSDIDWQKIMSMPGNIMNSTNYAVDPNDPRGRTFRSKDPSTHASSKTTSDAGSPFVKIGEQIKAGLVKATATIKPAIDAFRAAIPSGNGWLAGETTNGQSGPHVITGPEAYKWLIDNVGTPISQGFGMLQATIKKFFDATHIADVIPKGNGWLSGEGGPKVITGADAYDWFITNVGTPISQAWGTFLATVQKFFTTASNMITSVIPKGKGWLAGETTNGQAGPAVLTIGDALDWFTKNIGTPLENAWNTFISNLTDFFSSHNVSGAIDAGKLGGGTVGPMTDPQHDFRNDAVFNGKRMMDARGNIYEYQNGSWHLVRPGGNIKPVFAQNADPSTLNPTLTPPQTIVGGDTDNTQSVTNIQTLQKALDSLRKYGINNLIALGKAAKTNFNSVANYAAGAVTFLQTLQTAIGSIGKYGANFLKALGKAAKTNFDTVANYANGATGFVQVLQIAIGSLAKFGANLLKSLGKAAKTNFDTVANYSNGATGAVQTLQTAINSMVKFGIKNLSALAKSAKTNFNTVANYANGATKAVKALQSSIDALHDKTVTVTYNQIGGPQAKGGIYSFAGGGFIETSNAPRMTALWAEAGRETHAFIPHNADGKKIMKGLNNMFGTGSATNASINETVILKISGNDIINEKNLSKRIKLTIGENRDKFG